jgi:hypothetical protein
MYPDHQGDPMSEPSTHEREREAPGAVEQLARDDVARKRFLTMAGKRMGAGAAAAGLGAFIAACGSSSSSSSSSAAGTTSASAAATTSSSASSSPDLAIVNFALTLEYLETDFYQVKGASVGLSSAIKPIAKAFGEEESEHVSALIAAIKPPRSAFSRTCR